jgi:diguanylate cyclase (GGDEF)-like protein
VSDRASRAWVENHAARARLALADQQTFLARLGDEISRSTRRGSQLAVLLLDIDDFAAVNAVHGAAAGALVRARLGQRFISSLRRGDTIAHVDDHEFAVICPGLRSPHPAMVVADRLRTAAPRWIPVGGGRLSVTVSVGVAIGPRAAHADTVVSLLHRACASVHDHSHNRGHGGGRTVGRPSDPPGEDGTAAGAPAPVKVRE